MDFGLQPHASFIPKKPLAPTTPSGYRRRSVPIVTLIALIIFIGTGALAGGVFIYQNYLEQSLDSKKASLERARAAFEPALIKELGRLDKRLEHGKRLLSRHTALSSFFDILEGATLQNVQFRGLNILSGADGKISLNLNGIARSYASVALQSDVFGKARGIKDPIFSQLNLDSSGNVAFTVTGTLDPDVFLYGSVLSEQKLDESVGEDLPQGLNSPTPDEPFDF